MWWFQLWRAHPAQFASPMRPEEVRQRLASGLTPLRMRVGPQSWAALGPRVVVGKVRLRHVRLIARRPGVRNSWRPVFRGHLEPAPDGCRLAGAIGWFPVVRWFSFAWLAGAVYGLVSVCTIVFGEVRAGRGGPFPLTDVLFLGFLVGLVALFVALIGVAGHFGQADEDYLRDWLTRTLQEQPRP